MNQQPPSETSRLIKWSFGLLVIALGLFCLLSAAMSQWFHRGLLFGLPAFKIFPIVFILVWVIGSIVGYRRQRSIKFAVLSVTTFQSFPREFSRLRVLGFIRRRNRSNAFTRPPTYQATDIRFDRPPPPHSAFPLRLALL